MTATTEAELMAGYGLLPLERCTGETADCPHFECPDDWHWGDDLPCGCTPDCALEEDV